MINSTALTPEQAARVAEAFPGLVIGWEQEYPEILVDGRPLLAIGRVWMDKPTERSARRGARMAGAMAGWLRLNP